jgi:hypothetical protein
LKRRKYVNMEGCIDFGAGPEFFLWTRSLWVLAMRVRLARHKKQQNTLIHCFNRFSHCFFGNCSAKFSKM